MRKDEMKKRIRPQAEMGWGRAVALSNKTLNNEIIIIQFKIK